MELPNILMIVIDAGRADHFSCMSHLKPTTPGFDQLANQGVLFRQTISTAISTVPALASLLTRLSLFGPQNRKIGPFSCHNPLETKARILELLCGEDLPYCVGYRKAQKWGHVFKSDQPAQGRKRPPVLQYRGKPQGFRWQDSAEDLALSWGDQRQPESRLVPDHRGH